jgi:replicative DNA helicase
VKNKATSRTKKALAPSLAPFGDLASLPRWLLWRFDVRGGKEAKVPYQRNGKPASSTDPTTWALPSELEGAEGFEGLGFVFTGDGVGGVDLDHCRHPETGEIAPWAEEIIRDFGSYTEVSPSGRGVKIFAGGAPKNLPGNKYTPPGVEATEAGAPHGDIFLTARYFTVTGLALGDDPIREAPEAWSRLSARIAAQKGPVLAPAAVVAPRLLDAPDLSEELLERLRSTPEVWRRWEEGSGGGGDLSRNDASLSASMGRAEFSPGEIASTLKVYHLGQIGTGKLEGRAAERQLGKLLAIAQSARPGGGRPSTPPPWTKEPERPRSSYPDPIPLDLFPEAIRAHINSVAASLQVPTDLPAVVALGVLSAAVGRKARVEVRAGEWGEPVNLFVGAILPPGARKSPTFSLLMAPLVEWEREETHRRRPKRQAALDVLEVAKKRLSEVMTQAAKVDGSVGDGEVYGARMRVEKAEAEVPIDAAILLGDCTPESLLQRLAAQGGVGAIMEPEPGLFEGLLSGRYGGGGARLEEVNKAYSGEHISSSRVSRAPVDVPNPSLTLAVCIQPGVLEALEHKGAMRNQGTLARFLWVYPPDGVGRRKVGKEVPRLDQGAADAYRDTIRKLASAPHAGTDLFEAPFPWTITLSPEAEEVLEDFERRLEPTMDVLGENRGIRDWASKAAGRAVRVAALLQFAENVKLRTDPFGRRISERAMQAGVAVMEAGLSHARRVLGGTSPEGVLQEAVIHAAQKLADGEGVLSRRDLHQAVKGSAPLKTIESLEKVLQALEVDGCVRSWEEAPEGGGRPSILLQVHPSLMDPDEAYLREERAALGDL